MAWTNMFDLGPCTVEVWQGGELIDPADYDAQGLTVEVVDGEVRVERDGEASLGGLDVVVNPEYPTLDRPVRVLEMMTQDAGFNAIGYAIVARNPTGFPQDTGWSEMLDEVDQGGGLSHYTPDPMEFLDFFGEPWARAGVATRSGG